MREISINLGENSYQICIGNGILSDLGERLKTLNIGETCIVVTNPIVNNLFGSKVVGSLEENNFHTIVLEIPDGEKYKSLKTANMLYDRLLSCGVDRKSCIISLGGGVIGDLAGFVAATYMRGIPFVQVPTTLLAQLDSSVGGKTAVNHSKGKNLIGAFYQPKLVWIDIKTLKTLPKRELKTGLAEAIKYAMISDEKLFDYLKNNIHCVKKLDRTVLKHIITECCRIKADIVEKDEKENGLRTILNYGHTFGHALETLTNYKFRHGEAVAIGMICAADTSKKMAKINEENVSEQENLIRSAGLPTKIEQKISARTIVRIMQLDKKMLNGRMRMVLPRAIGQVFVDDHVPTTTLLEVLENRIEWT